jgi:DNA-binding NtrC family response regulator
VKARVVAQFEKSYLLETLLACDGNITKAAQLARKNRRAFWQLIRKHGINVHELKFNT